MFSANELRDGTRIWIIPGADRSVTTILLPKSIADWSLDGQRAAGPVAYDIRRWRRSLILPAHTVMGAARLGR